ncbi:EVE domain-containing protein [Methylovulum psychrotolerans]|uniref:EVE domain-containing protein n=1 Tax=Methylovulum psychrotolerans TaxID=1704499 RepID=UPI001BFF660B|nr:EVE domain-containing protein [Methylovulum psychrotolerans]MBT9097097.1 EVE domain-containing protein [Methylovulum psychrotolerans]
MRILLDTNIFIPLEDSSIDIDKALAELNRITSGKHQLLVHPATALDLAKDKNEDRKRKILARLHKYSELESPPAFIEDEEEKLIGIPKKDNDRIDNLILLAVHKNCVHWLVTNDEGIHKKAKRLGEQERVLTAEQAISALSELDREATILYPNIENIYCNTLDIKNVFFDSLRESYDFDNWFIEKCARTARKTWICRDNLEIHAICIYKLEKDPIITAEKKGLPGKILKLCTFKVLKHGYKIGELLLKQAFNHAIKNEIDHVYATIEPNKHLLLEALFIDFGFYKYGIDSEGRDNVYVKDFPKIFPINDDHPLEYAIKYYPLLKITDASAYIVPIRPKFHEILFPELKIQYDLFNSEISSAGNTIKKAYLCSTNTSTIKAGDIVFFYRTQDEMAITSYGIVDQFHIESEPEKIYQWVSKRTVYSYDEISSMSDKAIKIILFRLIRHLESKISFSELKQLQVITGPIQSVIQLSEHKVKLIIDQAKLNDCILSN